MGVGVGRRGRRFTLFCTVLIVSLTIVYKMVVCVCMVCGATVLAVW